MPASSVRSSSSTAGSQLNQRQLALLYRAHFHAILATLEQSIQYAYSQIAHLEASIASGVLSNSASRTTSPRITPMSPPIERLDPSSRDSLQVPPPPAHVPSREGPEANRASAATPQKFLEDELSEDPVPSGPISFHGHRSTQQAISAGESSAGAPPGSLFSNSVSLCVAGPCA